MTQTFKALLADENGEVSIIERTLEDLPQGEVTIRVHYSGVNFKDGLAALNPKSKTTRKYPHVPGIDLAGEVVDSKDDTFKTGDMVIVTSYELGVGHDGGFSEYARVPAKWVVPLPKGLTAKEAMIIGTAGFTAALSIHRLEQRGLTSEAEPILVTGATGGVGSIAISMLNKRGYSITASTGKDSEHGYLKTLGAHTIINREDVTPEKIKPLQAQRWAAAIDPTGGKPLASILSATKQGGAVAVSGLTAGIEIPTTVMPFILRGVDLLGIDSAFCPMDVRQIVWERVATDLKPDHLDDISTQIRLEQLPEALKVILQGSVRGRYLVKL